MSSSSQSVDDLKRRIDFLSGYFVAFKEQTHTDIMLNPNDGPSISAHRSLLAARSEIFKNILISDDFKAPPNDITDTITLSELNTEELNSFLEFLYTGDLPADKFKNHVCALYAAADKYEISYLQESCERYMLNSLNASNALDYLEFSDSNSKEKIKETTLIFILKNMKSIVASLRYEEFACRNPRLCVEVTRAFADPKPKYSVVLGSVMRYGENGPCTVRAIANYPGLEWNNKDNHKPRLAGLQIKWEVPQPGMVKVNTDAAVSTHSNRAIACGAFRDDEGSWLFGFSKDLGVCPVLQAELYAIYEGLKLAWERGFSFVQVESDSAEAIKVIQDGKKKVSNNALARGINELCNRQWSVVVKHVFREANCLADQLTKLAPKGDFQINVIGTVPNELVQCLREDKEGSYMWVR